jgi:hypothetical protein
MESDGDQVWMDDVNNFTFTSTNGGPNGCGNTIMKN